MQDKAKGDKEAASAKFKEISEAYDVLSGEAVAARNWPNRARMLLLR